MRERMEPILRILCLILAALLIYRMAGVFNRMNPLRGAIVPALPVLAASTNTTVMATGAKGTNSAAKMGTNNLVSIVTSATSAAPVGMNSSNNSVLPQPAVEQGTNSIARQALPNETNVVVHLETNIVIASTPVDDATNAHLLTVSTDQGSNLLTSAVTGKTNAIPLSTSVKSDISSISSSVRMSSSPVNAGRRTELPPAIQARISKITDSEILGPVMHPQPMALLGIAGEYAFLRSPSGQTGMVKLGDSVGELKLLQIGINRVLVEQNGQKQELMIFSGYGGESLLPK